MYVNIYTYIYIYKCINIYTYIYIHIFIYIHMYMFIHLYIFTYLNIYIFIYIYISIYIDILWWHPIPFPFHTSRPTRHHLLVEKKYVSESKRLFQWKKQRISYDLTVMNLWESTSGNLTGLKSTAVGQLDVGSTTVDISQRWWCIQ